MSVTRTDHPLNAVPAFPSVPFADGPDTFLTATTYERHCGCKLRIGMRLLKQEKGMLAHPCDAHKDRFDEVTDGMLTEEGRRRPTDEVFDDLTGRLDV